MTKKCMVEICDAAADAAGQGIYCHRHRMYDPELRPTDPGPDQTPSERAANERTQEAQRLMGLSAIPAGVSGGHSGPK